MVSRDGDNKLLAFEVDDKGSHKTLANPEKLVSLMFPHQWAVLHSLDGDEIANLMNVDYKKIIENLITDPNKDTKIKTLELSTNKILNEFGGLPFGSGRVRLNKNTFDILEADMVHRPAAGTVFLCGLAFQIAIISTRTKNQIKADMNITDAPIFFDDCFGRLEARMCSNILNYLTQISNQVILLNDKNRLPGLDKIGTCIGTELTFNRTADGISIKKMQIT